MKLKTWIQPLQHREKPIIWLITFIVAIVLNKSSSVLSISIENAAYNDLVIEIKDNVPVEKCLDVLQDLEVSLLIKGIYKKKCEH